jgi:hypothetical protein
MGKVMKVQPRLSVGLLLAVLLLAGSFVLPSALAQASVPFAATRTTTADLVSARVAIAELFDESDELVTYCFDQAVHQTVVDTGFSLVDYNAVNSVASIKATRTGEPRCVDVAFAPGVNVRQYSIAVIGPGTVKDERGFDSPQGAVRLGGSSLSGGWGDSTAPQLIDAEVDTSKNTITYRFDEFLDQKLTQETPGLVPGIPKGIPGGPTGDNVPAPASFTAWKVDGSAVPAATSVEAVKENSVTVVFPDGALADVVRFGVAAGSATAGVTDMQRVDRAGQTNPPGAIGGATSRPDLARALQVPDSNQIDFDFDALVESPDPAQFFAFAAGGESYTATRAVSLGNGRIRATFNDIAEFPKRIVHVYVGAGAVRDSAAPEDAARANIPGSADVGESTFVPGYTSGPDLTLAVIDRDNQNVRFEFDEELRRVPVLAPTDLAKFKISPRRWRGRSRSGAHLMGQDPCRDRIPWRTRGYLQGRGGNRGSRSRYRPPRETEPRQDPG